MNPYTKMLAVILLTIISVSVSHAQTIKPPVISGCWKVTRMDILHPTEDSAETVKEALKVYTCFDGKGKFTSKMKTATGFSKAGTGSYSISADGKTLIQSRDGAESGEDPDAKIILLTDKELVFQVEDDVIIHMQKTDN